MTSKLRWILGAAIAFAALVGLWTSIASAVSGQDDEVQCFALEGCGDQTTTLPLEPTTVPAEPTTTVVIQETTTVPATLTVAPTTQMPTSTSTAPTTEAPTPAAPSSESQPDTLPATGPSSTAQLAVLGLAISAAGIVILAELRRREMCRQQPVTVEV